MIKIDNLEVMNLENAVRGARNPKNSWDKSDSFKCFICNEEDEDIRNGCEANKCNCYMLGYDDLELLEKLCKAGPDHRKFLRQIFVSMDIKAPLYWWKEFDTYKVGTTANSCSTMHTIHKKPFNIIDFSLDNSNATAWQFVDSQLIPVLENLRKQFTETKDKAIWYSLIQLLPCSYNQMRTCTMNYEVLRNMYNARKNHKLQEWVYFCSIIESLPYAKEFIVGE